MKTLGIVAEYNPFHNGHLYHLRRSRAETGADRVVVVMSGSFVQRGEPAFADKWTRAKTAVMGGADLVLELPFAFACNNAEHFAFGAVAMLDRLGCVDVMSFGSENGETEALYGAAAIAASEEEPFSARLRERLDKGMPYPKAIAQTMAEAAGLSEDELSSPNNMLAVEYMKQLIRRGSAVKPFTVARDGVSSASKARELFKGGGDIRAMLPSFAAEIIDETDGRVGLEINDFDDQIFSALFRASASETARVFAAAEGIENKVMSSLRRARNTEELVALVKGRRYTSSRVRRLLLQHLIGLDKESFARIRDEGLLYGRVLALSETGGALLREIKKSELCDYPIVTNINRERETLGSAQLLLDMDIRAADLYNLAAGRDLYRKSDFVTRPFLAKDNIYDQY